MFVENPKLVVNQNSIYINYSTTLHNFPRDCDGLNVVTIFFLVEKLQQFWQSYSDKVPEDPNSGFAAL